MFYMHIQLNLLHKFIFDFSITMLLFVKHLVVICLYVIIYPNTFYTNDYQLWLPSELHIEKGFIS